MFIQRHLCAKTEIRRIASADNDFAKFSGLDVADPIRRQIR
jgi:hypothetical protein